MDLQTWTWLLVGITFALYIGIAIWSRAGSTKEFYVAGGGVSPLANGLATAADWMSAASFISMAGLISFNGYDGSVYLMGWTGGYVLLALLLAPYLRKFGKFTVPDFIGDRYYSNVQYGSHYRDDHRPILRCPWWHERHHIHASGSILCPHFCLYDPSDLHFYTDDG